jgi:hypothetical protein
MPRKLWVDLKAAEIEEAVRNLKSREQIEAAGSPTLIVSLIEERIVDPEVRSELLEMVISLSGGKRKGPER